MADDAKTLEYLKGWREDLVGPGALVILNMAINSIERLQAEVERLTPKPLNCFEICDLFNARKFHGRMDWRLFAEGDEPFHVGTESGRGGYFDADVADVIAQGLLRDAGPIAEPLEQGEGEEKHVRP